jgi:hypothetical protein
MKAICASVNFDRFMAIPRPTAGIRRAAKLQFSSNHQSRKQSRSQFPLRWAFLQRDGTQRPQVRSSPACCQPRRCISLLLVAMRGIKCLVFKTPFQAILNELGKDVQIRFA